MNPNLTPRQREALKVVVGDATHILLEGGSRSGKTFLFTRAVCVRAMLAPKSRHAIFRFRFNHIRASICSDTFPRVMEACFPGIHAPIQKTDWIAQFPNGSEVYFGGLDDKERTEKILGQEFATVYLNEISQIPYASRDMALTRLAQKVDIGLGSEMGKPLRTRFFYDLNPTNKNHWGYQLFHMKRDPETKVPLSHPDDYAHFQLNPEDNIANLSAGYLDTLKSMSQRQQQRFLRGEWSDANPHALFNDADIEKWRVLDGRVPDMVRVVVAVDPSGSGDEENADNDAIGIVIAGLGTDGNAYVLEDCTVKAGPATWGKVATSAYDRHRADCVVGESNYGGEMVRHTIQTARPRTPYRKVIATRGKVVRAEPVSSLYEAGKVRHVGVFAALEDELAGFSTYGYTGTGSPNRADALVWAISELFPGLTKPAEEAPAEEEEYGIPHGGTGWMAG